MALGYWVEVGGNSHQLLGNFATGLPLIANRAGFLSGSGAADRAAFGLDFRKIEAGRTHQRIAGCCGTGRPAFVTRRQRRELLALRTAIGAAEDRNDKHTETHDTTPRRKLSTKRRINDRVPIVSLARLVMPRRHTI